MAMTEEERFRFDLTGFLVRPSILSEDEAAELRDHVYRIHHEPGSLAPAERDVPGGPSAKLIDHPRVLDVLHEVIGPEVRLEAAFSVWRTAGMSHGAPMHGGGPIQSDPIFGYRVQNGRIRAGIVRVVFELNPVGINDGATQFLVGSHKANFDIPPEHQGIEPDDHSPFLTSYACPAGSAVFFTENLAHGGPPWRGEHPRVSILYAYSHIATNYHRLTVPQDVLDGLSREHQAYFRPVWQAAFAPVKRENTADDFLASEDRPIPSIR